MQTAAMSLESALEEERLAILKLLEKPRSPPPIARSPFPPPPTPLNQLHARTTSPTRTRVASLIDAASSSPPPQSPSQSPTLRFASPIINGKLQHDSRAPRLLRDLDKPEPNQPPAPYDNYQFAMLPSVPSQAVTKRVMQAGPVKSLLGGRDDDRFLDKGMLGKRSASPTTNVALRHAAHMRSASPRPGWGTDSARSSSGRLSSPPPGVRGNYITSENGYDIDLDHAYRKLNDEALASSGGVLGMLPEKRSGGAIDIEGEERLQKDYVYLEGVDCTVAESSEDDTSDEGETTSNEGRSDEEERKRGRRKNREDTQESDNDDDTVKKIEGSLAATGLGSGGGGRVLSSLLMIGPGRRKPGSFTPGKGSERRKTMSLLAAAEEERKQVTAKQNTKNKVQSLLPSISVTQPGCVSSSLPSSPVSKRPSAVCPSTNFDPPSQASTPLSSDAEADLRDLRRAQKLELKISPITSTPETHRVVRTITRGDFDGLQDEAELGHRRQRNYLVATDLSSEAAHALEWTIGTVLRDGDTLLAICAIEEGSVNIDTMQINNTNGTPEVASQTHAVSSFHPLVSPNLSSLSIGANSAVTSIPSSPLASFSTPVSRAPTPPAAGAASRRGSNDKKRGNSKERTKAEVERVTAAENITALITKLLKKTRLQVKCVVEVIHCKTPKHLLLEVIDYIEPTLVILGSRGRSALKGVLLGSFSNYLVTKSSVPVMVARKKLKQPKYKKKGVYAHGPGGTGVMNIRLANNLVAGAGRPIPGGALANAKVD